MNKFAGFLLVLSLLILPTANAQNLDYNYQSTYSVPIKLSITENFSTKKPLNEGDILQFKTIEDVYVHNTKILEKGTPVSAKIETLITSGMNGFPDEIILNHFEIPGIKDSQLMDEYIKTGQNRCIWVYPLKWALTPVPPVGSFTNLIKGGHAQIKTDHVITIYYYPEWK